MMQRADRTLLGALITLAVLALLIMTSQWWAAPPPL